MTPEERQRTMDFILQQQAQFSADIQREREERLAYRPRIARVEDCVIVLTELIQIQSRRLDWCDQQLNETRNMHKDSITRLDQILSRLTEKD
jgi:hypothetical protein